MRLPNKILLAFILLVSAASLRVPSDDAPVIAAAPSGGNPSISGTIHPASAAIRVTLLHEGSERASQRTGPDGSFTFSNLAAGRYIILVRSPGFADDRLDLELGQNEHARRSLRLLSITPIPGVDWKTGTIRARGVGTPPPDDSSPTIRREMAKRAALADAHRNLLRTLDRLEVGPGRTVRSFLGEGKYAERIQGFIRGYHVVAERERGDGVMEVELELPLTGPGGLSSQVLF